MRVYIRRRQLPGAAPKCLNDGHDGALPPFKEGAAHASTERFDNIDSADQKYPEIPAVGQHTA